MKSQIESLCRKKVNCNQEKPNHPYCPNVIVLYKLCSYQYVFDGLLDHGLISSVRPLGVRPWSNFPFLTTTSKAKFDGIIIVP